jgi:hypothetical protein
VFPNLKPICIVAEQTKKAATMTGSAADIIATESVRMVLELPD